MKRILLSILILLSMTSFAQQTNVAALEEEAKTNKRLLPKYGNLPKSPQEIEADKKFIEEMRGQAQFKGDLHAVSDHMIKLGFTYLNKGDFRTAMYRFNQAYLLDSTNTDIYWGYGAYYMAVGKMEEARKQYEEGLSKNPNNAHLLTDYGTYYMGHFYDLNSDSKEALKLIDTALTHLNKAFGIDNKNQDTAYKLSVCYWIKGNCEKAWQYYDVCKSLGGQPITEEYLYDLKQKCKNRK